MLAANRIVAFVGVRDPESAKAFYGGTLGLPLVAEDDAALVFNAGGSTLRVTFVQEVASANYTVLGWEVPDIEAAVGQLAAAGVRFEKFQGLLQDGFGIWESPTGAKVAWFRDPAGNILSLTEFPRSERRG